MHARLPKASPFDKDGTGCAELHLDKYQPILSLPGGATAFCTIPGLRTSGWSQSLLGATAEPGQGRHPHRCFRVHSLAQIPSELLQRLPWAGTVEPFVLINHLSLGIPESQGLAFDFANADGEGVAVVPISTHI